MKNVSSSDLKVGVIGAGYVGLVTGVCLARLGLRVGILEIDSAKLTALEKGEIPIYEPGLEEILHSVREEGLLSVFGNVKEFYSTYSPDCVFIAVGTPDNPDGSCNINYVLSAVNDAIKNVQKKTVLVLKSTVPVGTADKAKALIKDAAKTENIVVVNNPEFLKEGEAVNDFLKPARIVLGGTDEWGLNVLKMVYAPLLDKGVPLFVTDHNTAELCKLSANLALASRVSLINQISRLATAVGANVRSIEQILKTDPRIGSRYLFAGLGYGGSCFPKDVKNFINLCGGLGVDSTFAKAIDSFNQSQKVIFVKDIVSKFSRPEQTTISILGIAFKPETDDIREAPALAIVEELSKLGFKLKCFDPKASENFAKWANAKQIKNLEICGSMENALQNSDALVIACEWKQFSILNTQKVKSLFKGSVIYDGKNLLDPNFVKKLGFQYKGVGVE